MPMVDWICSVVGLLSLGGEPTVSGANAKPARHTNARRERGDDGAALFVSPPQHVAPTVLRRVQSAECKTEVKVHMGRWGLVELTAQIRPITPSRL